MRCIATDAFADVGCMNDPPRGVDLVNIADDLSVRAAIQACVTEG